MTMATDSFPPPHIGAIQPYPSPPTELGYSSTPADFNANAPQAVGAWAQRHTHDYPVPYVPAQQASNGLAVAGMVLGIVSLVLDVTVIGCFIGVPLAIIGFVLAIFGVRGPARGMATAGIVCSAIGFGAPFMLALLVALAQ
jgi:hypothetical protein